ncbi:uncharacterized protein BDW70DRAFT_136577 [Aspergillus foveolatus]|uniref:uncharacterized protein n=1 Tax=Aspergillus foveolatus TaxID=210207 RepID=UPI003CCE083E
MKSVLSLTALQLLASYVAAHPVKSTALSTFTDRSFPWHIGVPKPTSSDSRSKRDVTLPSTWDPPSDLVTPLQEVWDHEVETYSDALGFKNYGFDQVIAAGGKINYCVRWDSSQSVTAEQRSQIAQAASRSYNKWIAGLAGFDGWPYDTVEVNVVGWAVSDESLLEGDTSGIDIYTDTDADGIPQCAEACGRFFHQDGDYSGCAAGEDRHYDNSLWLTDGFEGGTGGDWGQRVGTDYFLQNLETENIHIYLHEIGHTFALDDFYDWTPTGVTSFIMLSGSATEITEFDYWMLRDWWRNLKDRYDLSSVSSSNSTSSSGSSSDSSSGSAATSSTPVYVPTTTATATSAPAGYVSLPTEVAVVEPSTSTSAVPTAPTTPVATPTGAGSESGNENPWSGSGWEQPSQGHPWWAGNSWWRQKAGFRS